MEYAPAAATMAVLPGVDEDFAGGIQCAVACGFGEDPEHRRVGVRVGLDVVPKLIEHTATSPVFTRWKTAEETTICVALWADDRRDGIPQRYTFVTSPPLQRLVP